MNQFSTIFHAADGTELFAQGWCPEGAPRGTLLVTHGQAEHSGCYQRLANYFVPAGWNTVGWDLRGHGKSLGKRGYVGNFLDYVADFYAFVEHLEETAAKPEMKTRLANPWVFVGHSLGALITLRALADAESVQRKAAAICLSSPFLGLALQVPRAKHIAAEIAFRIYPKLTLFNEIDFKDLTRDVALLPEYEADELRHDQISPGAYLGSLEAMAFLRRHAERIVVPLFMQIAGSDPIASPSAAEEVFARIGSQNKKKIVYPESVHEIYNDINRADVYRDLEMFLASLSVVSTKV